MGFGLVIGGALIPAAWISVANASGFFILRMKTFIRGDAVQRPFDIRCVGQHPSGPPGERLGQHRKRADVAFARREMSTLPPNALV